MGGFERYVAPKLLDSLWDEAQLGLVLRHVAVSARAGTRPCVRRRAAGSFNSPVRILSAVVTCMLVWTASRRAH